MCQMWALLGAIHTGFGKPPAAYRKPTTTLELQPYPPSLKTPSSFAVGGGSSRGFPCCLGFIAAPLWTLTSTAVS